MPPSLREITLMMRARDEVTRTLNTVAAGFRALQNPMTSTQKRLGLVSAGAGAAGIAMIGLGGAALLGMKEMGDSAVKFEHEMRRAFTQVDNTTRKQKISLNDIKDVAKDVANTVPAAFEDMDDLIYDIFSSIDVTLAQSRKLTTQFAKASVAGQADMESVSRLTISILNAFKIPVSDVNRVLDVQFQLVRKGIGTYQEFTNSMGRAIPAAARTGQEIEMLAGMLSFLTRQGLSTQMAATSAARALELMAHPKVVDGLEEMGIKVRDANGEFLPMTEIVGQLAKELQHLPGPERVAVLQELFKGAGYNIQARRFWDLAIKNFDDFNLRVNEMYQSRGAAKEAYRVMFDSPQAQIDLLKNKWAILRVEIGEFLVPTMRRLVSMGQTTIDMVRAIPAPVLGAIAQFITLAGAITVVMGVFGLMVSAWAALALLWVTLGGTLATFIGVVSGLGLALAAVGGIAYIFRDDLKSVVDEVVEFFGVGKKDIIDEWADLSGGLSESGDKIYDAVINDFIAIRRDAIAEIGTLAFEVGMLFKQIELDSSISLTELKNTATGNSKEITSVVTSEVRRTRDAAIQAAKEMFDEGMITAETRDKWIARAKEVAKGNIKSIKNTEDNVKDYAKFLDDPILWKGLDTTYPEAVKVMETATDKHTKVALALMAEASVGQIAVLEDLKARSGEITLAQAGEVIKNSNKQRNETVKNAEEQYKQVVEWVLAQWLAGTISTEQKDAMIKTAREQRDGVVDRANEMHTRTVREVQDMNTAVKDNVDETNGKVLTEWDKFKGRAADLWAHFNSDTDNSWSKMKNFVIKHAKSAWKGATDWFKQIRKDSSKVWSEVSKNAKEDWRQIRDGITRISAGIATNIRTNLNDGITVVEKFLNGIITGVNGLINLLNKLPGVDINKIGKVSLPRVRNVQAARRPGIQEYHGGGIVQGTGEVDARLLGGEGVLSNKAMKKIGPRNFRLLNDPKTDVVRMNRGKGGLLMDLFTKTLKSISSRMIDRFISPVKMSDPGHVGMGIQKGGINISKQAVRDLMKKVKEMAIPPLGQGSLAAAQGQLYQVMWNVLKKAFPNVRLHSAFRANAITAVGTRSYHGMGRAIDVSPWMKVFNWISRTYGRRTRELIFSPAGSRQIHNGSPHMYSGITRSMHWDHVHWAMKNGAYLRKKFEGRVRMAEHHPEIVSPVGMMRKIVRDESGGIYYIDVHLDNKKFATIQLDTMRKTVRNSGRDGDVQATLGRRS